MKFKNKKTGGVDDVEITNIDITHEKLTGVVTHEDGVQCCFTYSFYKFKEEWEDYKNEPYIIDLWEDGCIQDAEFGVELEAIERAKECGLYFKTKEEAEKAVEKLKAWKRLRDKGFRFSGFSYTELCDYARTNIQATMINDGINNDLDLLFGGEE